jgi:hypothetical protein
MFSFLERNSENKEKEGIGVCTGPFLALKRFSAKK